MIEDDATIILKEMCKQIKKTHDLEISQSTLERALQKMNITWKNTLDIPDSWNTLSVIQQRQVYVGSSLIRYVNCMKFYIDEQAYHMQTKKSKGRALAGESAKLTLRPKSKRLSVIACLGESGMVHHKLINTLGEKKRGVNGDDFHLFLMDVAKKLNRYSVLIFDNAKIHHSDRVKQALQILADQYQIFHLFLPSYSPFLNPIEYAFNTIRLRVNSEKFFTFGELCGVVDRQTGVITKEQAHGYFQKSQSYHPQVMLGLPFQGKPLNPQIMEPSLSNVSNQPVLTFSSTQ